MMTTDTEVSVRAIRVRTALHDGIYASDRRARDIEGEWEEPTEARLSYALDMADRLAIENVGSFGSVGAGATWVEIELHHEQVLVVVEGYEGGPPDITNPDREIAVGDAYALMPERGTLTREELNILTGDIWDGNNHVTSNPTRSQEYCDEPDQEEFPWGLVEYTTETDGAGWRYITNSRVNPDWVTLIWYDTGGMEDVAECLADGEEQTLLDQIQYREEFSDLPDLRPLVEVYEFAGDEVEAIFCRRADLPAVLAVLRRAA